METVRRDLVFNKGHIAPKIGAKPLREIRDRIKKFDNAVLCENIREDLGYTEESLGQGAHPEREAAKFALVEKGAQILVDSCSTATRENGKPVATHSLMAGALGAATGERTRTIILDLFHDLVEDTRDDRYPEIKFRVQAEQGAFEYDTDRKIYLYVKGNFGRYGKGLARDMRVMTRYVKESPDKSWQRIYKEYLCGVHRHIDPMLAKGNDSYVNLLDLSLIEDRATRLGKAHKLILKAFWNAERLKRISWIKSCLIQSGIRDAPGGRHYAKILNDVSKHDIDKFERGWAYNAVRQFDAKLFKTVNLSGSPALDLYRGSDTHADRYEVEFPFVLSEEMATAMLRYAFGKSIGGIMRTKSLLPTRLTSATIFSFSSGTRDLEGCMARLVRVYDDLLSSGILLPQLEGFDRKEWADAARERMERVIRERKGA